MRWTWHKVSKPFVSPENGSFFTACSVPTSNLNLLAPLTRTTSSRLETPSLPTPKEMEYVMGSKTFVKGFEYGLEGCCVGEQRTIVIPPHLAYGERGHPPYIPPNAALKFHLKVLDIVAHDLDAQRRGHRDFLPFSEGLVAFLGAVFVVSVMIWRRLRLNRASTTGAQGAPEREAAPSTRTERASPSASVSSPLGSERGGRRRMRARME